MGNIEDLERKEQSLRDQLSQVRLSLKAAREEAFPVKVGDVVMLDKGRSGVVASIENPEWKWIRVFYQLKDGSIGKASHSVYSQWKVPPSAEAEKGGEK